MKPREKMLMSDRRRSVRLAAAVSSILAAPAAIAQETTSSLSGFVVGADGLPIAGATGDDRAHADRHHRS